MIYTVGEMAKKIGVAASTLRYYDQQGLLPFVERTDSGIRLFRERDAEWLQVITCLKKTGMQLKDIKIFIEMAMQGDQTIDARLAMIVKQKEAVRAQISELEETLGVLNFKEWYYTTAKACGTTEIPKNMESEEIPEPFRAIREKLRGE